MCFRFFLQGIFPTQGMNAAPALTGGFFSTEPPGKPHRLNCIPHKDANVQFAVPVKVTDFGNRIFVGDQVEMRSLGWALTQYDWCLIKRGDFAQTDSHVKTTGVQPHVKELPEAGREAHNTPFLSLFGRSMELPPPSPRS